MWASTSTSSCAFRVQYDPNGYLPSSVSIVVLIPGLRAAVRQLRSASHTGLGAATKRDVLLTPSCMTWAGAWAQAPARFPAIHDVRIQISVTHDVGPRGDGREVGKEEPGAVGLEGVVIRPGRSSPMAVIEGSTSISDSTTRHFKHGARTRCAGILEDAERLRTSAFLSHSSFQRMHRAVQVQTVQHADSLVVQHCVLSPPTAPAPPTPVSPYNLPPYVFSPCSSTGIRIALHEFFAPHSSPLLAGHERVHPSMERNHRCANPRTSSCDIKDTARRATSAIHGVMIISVPGLQRVIASLPPLRPQ
ncbi:hypothetical protein LshimejAT787_1205430 [Lyophyllum shimeji]|uniref:Uncharacterized protein n=1 Tax=Lyophyllum shimeji TaxID=47721 RepID=A0A9P3PX40_LYOSH|nr:hypothetical protein LshimejAT787_1205430 [Lyophyllum shimeji]